MTSARVRAFRLNPLLARYVPGPVATVLAPPLELLLSLRRAAKFYANIGPTAGPLDFARRSLALLATRFEVSGSLESIPASGPLVVIANHPFGGIEGLYLYSLLAARRPDVRVLGTQLLARIEELAPVIIAVDNISGRAAARNALALRRALRWVKSGGSLLVFPAGEVATVDAASRTVVDPAWHASIGRLVELSGANVVPVYVDGANSRFFHAAGFVHPRLRTALLPRELFNKKDRAIQVHVGSPVPAAMLAALGGGRQLLEHLRLRVYALAAGLARNALPATPARPPLEEVAAAVPVARLQAEIAALPADRRLVASGELEVWQLGASEAPWLMQELGRLRELTFRAVGEGTGRARDIDLYDSYYDQLVVWNRRTQEVVGGYRIGAADRIRARFGARGLNTSTQLDYHRTQQPSHGMALELGRSFVRPEYQKHYASLLVLWKAIGAYLASHPQYRVLFGPVSISNAYPASSRALLTGYLRAHHVDAGLARLARGRQSLPGDAGTRLLRREAARISGIEALDVLLRELAGPEMGVPVLLRQYLKLGARVIGFNVDHAFGHSIDALVVVRLDETDPATVAKYMGREAAAAYLSHGRPGAGRALGGAGGRGVAVQVGDELRG
jgi:putative hemolysin